MLGSTLVTHQTGPDGKQVNRVYVEDGCDIARELYLGLLVDRADQPRQLRRLDRGRHGHRGGRREDAREDPARSASIRPPATSRFHGRRDRLRARASRATQVKQCVDADGQALQGLRRQATARWSRSTRWSSPTTATSIALDAKINFDDNALFRHPDIAELRDDDEEDPTEVEAGEVRPQLHRARRQHRLHGQRRRPGHGDDGHHQALRRRAGQLPRRRRRRHQGEGHRRRSRSSSRPEGEGHPGQHLRRHHALRRHRRGRRRGGQGSRASRCRWSCASKAPTSKQGKKILAESGLDRHRGRRPRRTPPRRSSTAREGGKTSWPFSSTRTPRSSARASPARRAPSTPSRRSTTAPRWSAA